MVQNMNGRNGNGEEVQYIMCRELFNLEAAGLGLLNTVQITKS